MKFEKGHTPWNKSKKLAKTHIERISESSKVREVNSMEGKTKANGLYPEQCGFSKGHKKYTDRGEFKKGHIAWNEGTSEWITYTCIVCGKTKKVRKCHIRKDNGGKYCSRDCFNKAKEGQTHLDKRKRLVKVCQHCGEHFEVRFCENYRKFCSRKCARKPLKPYWGEYRGIKMRSGWEIAYAKWLDKRNIKWEYESRTFDLGYTTYTPDFRLADGVYVEIKGYMTSKALKKIKLFLIKNPDVKYSLLMEGDLKKLGVLV